MENFNFKKIAAAALSASIMWHATDAALAGQNILGNKFTSQQLRLLRYKEKDFKNRLITLLLRLRDTALRASSKCTSEHSGITSAFMLSLKNGKLQYYDPVVLNTWHCAYDLDPITKKENKWKKTVLHEEQSSAYLDLIDAVNNICRRDRIRAVAIVVNVPFKALPKEVSDREGLTIDPSMVAAEIDVKNSEFEIYCFDKKSKKNKTVIKAGWKDIPIEPWMDVTSATQVKWIPPKNKQVKKIK